MTINSLARVIFIILAIIHLACSYPSLSPTKAIPQTFYFQNNGKNLIDQVRVYYGDVVLPSTRVSRLYPLNRISGMTEGRILPVPQSITIEWKSVDGVDHHVSIPLWDLVSKQKNLEGCFEGCKFVFMDNHVEIYMIDTFRRKSGRAAGRYDSRYIKIYSSN